MRKERSKADVSKSHASDFPNFAADGFILLHGIEEWQWKIYYLIVELLMRRLWKRRSESLVDVIECG